MSCGSPAPASASDLATMSEVDTSEYAERSLTPSIVVLASY